MATVFLLPGAAAAFDSAYAAYGALLERHVHWIADGHASVVDYDGLKRDSRALDEVLQQLSGVDQAAFDRWQRPEQMAFLINAYNAFTLKLILSEYPDLRSIRDLGSLLRSPWKKAFFELLGDTRTLDWIEHEQLRPRYREPRVHFAVNCASIGCPALRPEPYVGDRLDAQLDDQMRRFLGDRTRNRYNAKDGVLHVSRIFDWFDEDFDAGGQGVKGWLAAHAELLGDSPADRERLRGGDFSIDTLSYDWSLNRMRKPAGATR